MTLLDANALLSLLLGQPAEERVSSLLHRGNCAIPAACLAEVIDALIRTHGIEPSSVSERLGALINEVLAVLPMDQRTAWRAGELRAAHYHRTKAALSLADCLLLASAAGTDDEIATSDSAVIATARKLEVSVVVLPNAKGQMPEH